MKRIICFGFFIVIAFTSKVIAQDQSIFPLGEKAKNVNHTGDVWLRELHSADGKINSQISVAVFAPNAKLNWHTHTAGQILIITDGKGYYQERGKPVQIVKKGDVVKCLPDVEHWHGSTPTTGVTYVAVSPKSKTNWMDVVDDSGYQNIEDSSKEKTSVETELKTLSMQK
ncbi:cupin domain-containing protein [Sphingobacterium bovisgrunnientis]|uniref:cupin domain-containing protein n=1 Tax=Sphingobacterium bovisgrunnientis TaxID=1874697 RepID=UPI0013583D44|nr:cupin domain-containing protein [Sphingobacterium bovisgrunnientis]